MSSLTIFAGPHALQRLRSEGLNADQFKVMLGASGGPKWFVLFGLDRYIFGEFFANRERELITLGSSAGAWRMSCLATADPVAAIERLAKRYSEEQYSEQPTTDEITEKARQMLVETLGSDGVKEIVENQIFRTHIIADRARGIGSSRVKQLRLLQLLSSALLNVASRKTLSLFFERNIFSNMGSLSPFRNVSDLATAHVAMNEENLMDAMMASGSIPFVLNGVRDIQNAKRGMYWDGGITDYHFDFPFHAGNDLVLYPHFSSTVIPGWFDKRVPWRRVNPKHFENVVMVVPSREFVAQLPYGKIPDRTDFETLDYSSRVAYWSTVLEKSKCLADDFAALVESGAGIEDLQPFTGVR
ncbi:MAG: patatin-like phospholipase family protein [Gammaproteobacteria bacterium]|nr:patatin-like phospholipase family protein [Gammaproteobacteria bacterium]